VNPELREAAWLLSARSSGQGSFQPTIAKRGFSTATTGSATAHPDKKSSGRALASTRPAPITHRTSCYAILNQTSEAKPSLAQPGSRAAWEGAKVQKLLLKL